jgi:hypothetical protein
VSKLSIGPTQAHSESKHAGGQVYEVDEKTEIRKGTPLVEGKRREKHRRFTDPENVNSGESL